MRALRLLAAGEGGLAGCGFCILSPGPHPGAAHATGHAASNALTEAERAPMGPGLSARMVCPNFPARNDDQRSEELRGHHGDRRAAPRLASAAPGRATCSVRAVLSGAQPDPLIGSVTAGRSTHSPRRVFFK